MAIRVYLDTSDYFNLYKNRTQQQEEIYGFLRKKVLSNEIEVGFSFPIISEFLQDFSPKDREDRIQRARFIKSLCGKNCFKFIDRLGEKEAFSYDGDWTPKVDSVFSLEKLRKVTLDKVLKNFSAKSRSTRNSFKNKRWLTRLIKNNREIFDTQFKDLKFPVSDKFIKDQMLVRYLAGELSKVEVEKEFFSILTDIELFISVWFDFAEKGNALFDFIHKSDASIRKTISKLREYFLFEEQTKKMLRNSISEAYRNDYSDEHKKKLKELKNKMLDPSELYWNMLSKAKKENPELCKYPDSFFEVFHAYIFFLANSEKPIKDSDTVDIVHAAYIPFCDLWRGDKDFSNILVSQNINGKEKIVFRLRDLPDRISEMLLKTIEI